MNHDESSDNHDEFPFPAEADTVPIGTEDAFSGKAASPRRSAGTMAAVFGQLIAVAFGGVTVLGAYFLFRDDLLQTPQKPAGQEEPRHEASHGKQPPLDSEKTSDDSLFQRERAANRALGLAQKMADQNPSAAEKWFRKVVTEHPQTKAAMAAEEWLNQRKTPP